MADVQSIMMSMPGCGASPVATSLFDRRKIAAAGLALVLSVMAMPMAASAAPISLSYNGIVSGGTDTAGMFGGGSLIGDQLSISMTYDPTAYSATSFNVSSFYDIFTNDTAGASSVSVQLTTLTNQTYNYTLTNGAALNSDTLLASGSSQTNYGVAVYQYFAGHPTFFGALIPTLTSSDPWVSGTSIYATPTDVTSFSIVTTFDASSGVSDNITVSEASAGEAVVPEPASLSLLGLGTAALAWGRRRRAASPAR